MICLSLCPSLPPSLRSFLSLSFSLSLSPLPPFSRRTNAREQALALQGTKLKGRPLRVMPCGKRTKGRGGVAKPGLEASAISFFKQRTVCACMCILVAPVSRILACHAINGGGVFWLIFGQVLAVGCERGPRMPRKRSTGHASVRGGVVRLDQYPSR